MLFQGKLENNSTTFGNLVVLLSDNLFQAKQNYVHIQRFIIYYLQGKRLPIARMEVVIKGFQ